MPTIKHAALLLGIALIAIATMWPIVTKSDNTTPKKTWITDRQAIWLDALVWCESRGVPSAVNPKDRDGTPSLGILQFKPSTFQNLSKKYDVPGELMDPMAQMEIVRHMIGDRATRWEHEFPDCVKKLGRPPSDTMK